MSCQLRGQKGVRAFLNGGMKNVKTMMHSAKVITLNARRALTLPRAAQHVRRRIIVAFVTSCQQKQYSLSFRANRCRRMMLLLLLLYDRCPQCALTRISSLRSPSHPVPCCSADAPEVPLAAQSTQTAILLFAVRTSWGGLQA